MGGRWRGLLLLLLSVGLGGGIGGAGEGQAPQAPAEPAPPLVRAAPPPALQPPVLWAPRPDQPERARVVPVHPPGEPLAPPPPPPASAPAR